MSKQPVGGHECEAALCSSSTPASRVLRPLESALCQPAKQMRGSCCRQLFGSGHTETGHENTGSHSADSTCCSDCVPSGDPTATLTAPMPQGSQDSERRWGMTAAGWHQQPCKAACPRCTKTKMCKDWPMPPDECSRGCAGHDQAARKLVKQHRGASTRHAQELPLSTCSPHMHCSARAGAGLQPQPAPQGMWRPQSSRMLSS